MTLPASGNEPLQIAIAGAGLMGAWHAASARRAGGRIRAIIDPDSAAAERLAARFPGARTFSSLADALDGLRIDIVHLCLPTPQHVAQARIGIDHKVHLLIEKPLAPDAPQTQELYDLARLQGVSICPVHQFIFQQGLQRLLTRLAGNADLLDLRCTIYSAGASAYTQSLDRVAADILPHPLSLIQALHHGRLKSISWSAIHPAPGEIAAQGMAGQTTYSIRISLSSRPTLNVLTVTTATGTGYADLFHGFAYWEPGGVSKTRKVIHPFETSLRQFTAAGSNLLRRSLGREPAYPGLLSLISRFYASVCGDGPLPLSPCDVLAVALVRDVLLEELHLS